jgi:predicted signal transduction protein with EAL and GGDEF domain
MSTSTPRSPTRLQCRSQPHSGGPSLVNQGAVPRQCAFIQNLTRSEDDRAFVHTLIDLARRLGLETVAEWVQDEEAAAILAGWGCDYLQGALVGLASTERPWRQASDLALAE